MNRILTTMAVMLLISTPLLAAEPYIVIDYSKVDTKQYCVFDGKLYTRGIRIKTDTGIYTCRINESKRTGESAASREVLSWVREAL